MFVYNLCICNFVYVRICNEHSYHVFVQLLGSGGTIVWVMFLSTIVLSAKYRLIHFAGVGICLLGIGALVYADIHNGKSQEGNYV